MTTATAAPLVVADSRQWKIRAAETFCWAVWATLLLTKRLDPPASELPVLLQCPHRSDGTGAGLN